MKCTLALILTLGLPAGLAPPAAAETPSQSAPGATDEGFSLIEEGAKLILRQMIETMEPELDKARKGLTEALAEWEPALRDLAGKVGDLSAYHPPMMLPNGDIIIRRKRVFGPEMPGSVGPDGQVDL
jgi:hypothetical protein